MESDDDKTQTHMLLTNGMMVGHYRIVEKIGSGGMGEVYLAEDTELDRRVALKFLPPHLCRDDDCRKRFKREAQAAAKLNHSNIVTIYEVSEYQGRPFFAMEYCPGKALREQLQIEEPTIFCIIQFAIAICEGLQEAHTAGIIHRDVKPANIMIDKGGRPKLLDFGLAVVKGTDELTKTGSTLGTVGYMSPEQVRGEQTDARSDLFSLGVVLYEMLAGKRPFIGDTDTTILHAITDSNPQPPARYRADLPDELSRIVLKLLDKNPGFRYQSAGGVLSDLGRLAEGKDQKPAVLTSNRTRMLLFVSLPLVTVAILVIALAAGWFIPAEREPADQKIRLVVLPFENLGDPADEYFADGITEEITARLFKVRSIAVIARTSAMRYKATDKSIQQIGDELDVSYVLEGTIRWQSADNVASRVRVTPQLIRVSDESHVWAEIYDDELTEVFAVQADIAGKVVGALGVSLAENELEALQTAPTDNLEAYDYYLRGREYWHRFERPADLMEGLAVLDQAVKLDSTFANAYADISSMHSFLYWTGADNSDERLEAAWQTAKKAVKYDATDSYSHLALGYYYYYGSRDFKRALDHFERALERSPNSADIWAGIGYVKRRMGLWEESLEAQKAAMKLDPLSVIIRQDVVYTALLMRRYTEALQTVNRGLDLFPSHSELLYQKTWVHLVAEGDPLSALAALNTATYIGNDWRIAKARYDAHLVNRDYDAALADALEMKKTSSWPTDTAWGFYELGRVFRFKNEAQQNQIWLDSAAAYIQSLHDRGFLKIGFLPPGIGPILAGLGRTDEAIRAAREEAEFMSVSFDALIGAERLQDLARTYTIVGEYDLAIETLDSLLSIPSEMSVPLLRMHPDWDPLRDHPRFQALLIKHEKESDN